MNFQFKDLSFNLSDAPVQAGREREAICTPTCVCTLSTCTKVSCTCTINPSTNGCNFSFNRFANEHQAQDHTVETLLLAQLRAELAVDEADLVLA